MRAMLTCLVLLGCEQPRIIPDAVPIFDFFGESCVALPFPVNTVCHDGRGWCIGPDRGGDGICRPMPCCPICPPGTERYAPAGAAFCAP